LAPANVTQGGIVKRSLHVVRPPVVAELDLDILESYAVYDHFTLAAELWRLAGHPERAQAIEGVVTRAYRYDVPLLTTPDIVKLLELLGGLSDAVVGTITDGEHKIPVDRLPELRMRTKLLDVTESRGSDAVFAVQEALVDVENLEGALRSALQHEAHVVFD
jgi:hypothetical protein